MEGLIGQIYTNLYNTRQRDLGARFLVLTYAALEVTAADIP